MEVGGLAVGIVALAGLFNNAMDCFEYVQLGCSFGNNFQTNLLKLDNARLRLSRWGQAVGLSGDLEDALSLQEATVQKEDIDKAERVLGHILDLFAEAEEISAKYKRSVKPDDLGQSLHAKMRKLCIKRQNGTMLRQKVKWALYEEKHFKSLIEDIIELVCAFAEVFLAVKQEQLRLCEFEVSGIGTEYLCVLMDIVRSQDKDFRGYSSCCYEIRCKYMENTEEAVPMTDLLDAE
ncbi:small s protein [Paraphoma chrysanthemicola]|nr:small s protein [Paraphoma chrysanthemicola]